MKKLSLVSLLFALLMVSSQAFAGYSAIAYNSATRAWGEAHGYDGSQDAVDAAVAACGSGCVWLAWAQDSCVALANNAAGDYGYAWGYDNADDATNAAMASCDARNTGTCGWLVWACN